MRAAAIGSAGTVRMVPFIVLIEPEWPTRSYLRAELEELGFEVSVQDHPRAALEHLERWGFQPHLIVVDVGAIGVHDPDLRQLLDRYPETPLLLLARPFRAVPDWLRRRATVLLDRPLAIREVVDAVRRLLAPLMER